MEKKEARYSWIPAAMPGVAKLVAEYRAKWGDAHVSDCIRRGLAGEAGFFFAREAQIAVGTPFDRDPVLIDTQWRTYTATQATLLLRRPAGESHGTD